MKLKYEFETMEMDDEIVAVPVGDNADEFHGVIRLNDSAAAIFKLLTEETTEEAVVAKLLKEYEVDESTLVNYVHEYVTNLQAEGMLI